MSTNRDFKSFLPNSFRNLGEAEVSGVSAPEPLTSTPPVPKTQAAADPSVEATSVANLERLVNIAYNLHRSANGSTVSLVEGNMVGRKLFAVSIYPERSLELGTAPTWRDLFAFVVLNLDLLLKPSHALGGWLDRSRNVHVLDVVLCLSDRRTTLALGPLFRQTSIYDLATQREIPIRARCVRRARVGACSAFVPDSSDRSGPKNRKAKVTVR